MSCISPGNIEARYYAQVCMLSKVVRSNQKRTRGGTAKRRPIDPAASSKVEACLVKARGKSGTSHHFFANRCSAYGKPEVLVRMMQESFYNRSQRLGFCLNCIRTEGRTYRYGNS
jgi:hypothetical protein